MRCRKMILFGTNVCCLMMQCFVATFLSEVPNVAPITALGHCKGMGHPPATMGISTEVCWRNSKEQWIASFPFAMDLSDFSHFFVLPCFFAMELLCWSLAYQNIGVSNTMTMAFVSSNAGGRQGTTLVEHTLEEVSREEGSQIVGCVDGWIMSVQ